MKTSAANKVKEFEFRGVQLDLARQVENMDYLKSFIDFTHNYGYNYLVLYLEGRIRTKTFPYMAANESYTPDEMRRIVDYAGKKKIDVIPVMSTLGHAEHFLKHPELEHLAELRDDRVGRFSTFKHVFCPSLSETYEFLGDYLEEISGLFPSEYFHAGCDEAWDIGYCDLCKKRLESETQADIFAAHLIESHSIIAKKLKKKMLMWDDLFENYPQALKKIPKDIIMCMWHYDKLADKPQAHFGNKQRIDKLAQYESMGFKHIFAPRESSMRNISTLSSYASKYTPIGGLVTVWELSHSFLLSYYPAIAYAGLLWSGKQKLSEEELQEQVVRDVIGVNEKHFVAAARAVLNTSILSLPANRQSYLRGELSEEEYDRSCLIGAALASLQSVSPKALSKAQYDILEDLLIALEIETLYYELRKTITVLFAPSTTKSEKALADKQLRLCIEKAKTLKASRKKQWNKHRNGITPCHTDTYFDSIINMLSDVALDSTKGNGVLKATFFLPEFYSAQHTEFHIKHKGRKEWEKIAGGVFKQCPFNAPFYTYNFLIAEDGTPEAIRVDSWGYGGQGLAFLEVENTEGRFVPASIAKIEGRAENPEYLLEEDQKWCFMGERDTRRAFTHPSIAQMKHSIEITLKKAH